MWHDVHLKPCAKKELIVLEHREQVSLFFANLDMRVSLCAWLKLERITAKWDEVVEVAVEELEIWLPPRSARRPSGMETLEDEVASGDVVIFSRKLSRLPRQDGPPSALTLRSPSLLPLLIKRKWLDNCIYKSFQIKIRT